MKAAAYVGRVGRLAVALGIGAAVITGYGCGPAWADDTGDGTAASQSEPSDTADTPDTAADSEVTAPTDTEPEPEDESEPEPEPELEDEQDLDVDEFEEEPELERKPEPEDVVDEPADGDEPPAATVAATQLRSQPEADDEPADVEVEAEAIDTEPVAVQPLSTASPVASATTSAVLTPPTVPTPRPWPTAYTPATAVNYVVGLVTTFVNAVLSPFTAGLPAPPSGPPTLWTVLAWVRREFFNSTPTIAYNPLQNSQSLDENGDVVITGNIGAADADGDPLTYTVIGRPHYGGVVEIAEDGTFTYRPMNAMAAVGGYDEFVVVVDDEAAGLHLHGPLGLLQFVPVLGNLINPGGAHRVARTIRVDIAPVDGVDLSFPDGFHWGVAYSGFQAEGGPGSPVDPNSDWYKWVHDPLNQLLGLTRGVPENGPGAYVKYEEDAALARDELQMNTFRMGIEWSRIFPNSTARVDISDEGGGISLADLQALDALADQDEVAHYRDVLAALRDHGLEPMVTVTHFTLPAWVHDPASTRLLAQLGLPAPAAGWLSPATATEFEKYAAYLAWKYGDQVDNWATLNEPVPPVLTQFFALPGVVPSWPPGVIRPDLASTFLVNQAKAHVAGYEAIHAWDTVAATDGQPAAFVGFTNNMLPNRPANPINPLDVDAANAWNRMFNEWFLNAVVDGWVDANLDGIKTPDEIHPEFVGKTDFIGVQYYGSERMQGIGFAPIPGFPFFRGIPLRCQPSSPTCSDFNQPIDPGGFREVLEVAASYGKPLWVTENGIADDEDTKRPGYIATHTAVVQDLVAHGADIRGYTYWSLVDNLEWSEGYHLQFGLYGSDPATPELERTPKPASIGTISAIAGSNSLPLWVLQQYVSND